MTATDDATTAHLIADLARQASGPVPINPDTLYLRPDSQGGVVLGLEAYRDHPLRNRGTATLHDLVSLIRYVIQHDLGMRTSLWADTEKGQVVAVLNGDDGVDQRGWGDHRADFVVRETEEAKRWRAGHGQLVNQIRFAEHVERSTADFRAPTASDMLEMALSFEAHQEAQFRQATTLQSGAKRFLYDETIEARAGKGAIEVPDSFTIAIPLWQGGDLYEIACLLRYRLHEGALTIGYELVRWQETKDEAFRCLLSNLAEQTGHPIYAGVPPLPIEAQG